MLQWVETSAIDDSSYSKTGSRFLVIQYPGIWTPLNVHKAKL